MFDVEIIALAILVPGSIALVIAIAARKIRRRRAMSRNAMKVMDGRRP